MIGYMKAVLCAAALATWSALAAPLSAQRVLAEPSPWADAATARTVARLKQDPSYRELSRLSEDVNATAEAGRFEIFGEWVYEISAHGDQAGSLRRATLSSLRSGFPQWEILLDIGVLRETEGRGWNISRAICRPDGARCLLTLYETNFVQQTIREFNPETRAFVQGGFEFTSSTPKIGWKDNDTVYFIANLGVGTVDVPDGGILREWRRGQPIAEAREVYRAQALQPGNDPRRGTTMSLFLLPDSRGRLIYRVSDLYGSMSDVANDNAQTRTFLLGLGDQPVAVGDALRAGRRVNLYGIVDDQLFFGRPRGWLQPNELLSVAVSDIAVAAPAVQSVRRAEPGETIGRISITSSGLLRIYSTQSRARLERVARVDGRWESTQIELPENGVIDFLGSDPSSAIQFISFSNIFTGPMTYEVNASTLSTRALVNDGDNFDSLGYTVEHHVATSADGMRIPYFVASRTGRVDDGTAPTILEAYGNSGPFIPYYRPGIGPLWLARGGVFVHAVVRGGVDFDQPNWFVRGVNRERVKEDLEAVAMDLVHRRITSPAHMGFRGHSMGGLVAGIAFNRQNHLFRAWAIENPVLDISRNLIVGDPRFMSGDAEADTAYIRENSPLQNLRLMPNSAPPFIVTATNDYDVHPRDARSFGERLEQLGMPFYFWESRLGGHGACSGQAECAEYRALYYTYFSRQLMSPNRANSPTSRSPGQ